MAKVSSSQKLMNRAGSKKKLEKMTPAKIKQAASKLKVKGSKVLDTITKLQDTGFAGVTLPKSNKLNGDVAPAAAARVPQKDAHAAVAGPPKDIQEAESRISDKLGAIADVSFRGPQELQIRFETKDKASIEKGLAELGVRKYNTGMRDGYRFGEYELTVAAYGTVSMA
jgi:hypothetical protein